MNQFQSIEKIDTGILYILELASSLSVILLAIGLITSMANVLTAGQVLTRNPLMEISWAWVQCAAIDLSVPGTIIRTFRYHAAKDTVKTWLYGLLSAILLFTAAIVSNIESVQQTLNLTLNNAYLHVFIPIEALIWVRSVAIVLLIVAHSLRHVHLTKSMAVVQSEPVQQVPSFVLTPELVETLRALLAQTTVSEDVPPQQVLPAPHTHEDELQTTEATRTEEIHRTEEKTSPANFERVKAYLAEHPQAKVREVAEALNISIPTSQKWMVKVREV